MPSSSNANEATNKKAGDGFTTLKTRSSMCASTCLCNFTTTFGVLLLLIVDVSVFLRSSLPVDNVNDLCDQLPNPDVKTYMTGRSSFTNLTMKMDYYA